MNQSQKEFEAWAAENEWDVAKYDGSYLNCYTAASWAGWQASRAALVVELPNYYEFDTVSAFCSDVEDRLEAANLHRVCVDSDSGDCFSVSISARSHRNNADIISTQKLAAVAAFFMLDNRLYF